MREAMSPLCADTADMGQEGFSLVEVVVTLAIVALIAVVMTTTFQQLSSIRKLQRDALEQEVASSISRYLATEIEHARAEPLADDDPDTFPPMIGTAAAIRFVGIIRIGFASEGLRDVLFSSDGSTKDSPRIIRTSSRRSPSNKDSAQQVDEVYAGPSSIEFRYLAINESGAATWVDHWSESGQLPKAVSLKVTITKGDREFSAERIINLARY